MSEKMIKCKSSFVEVISRCQVIDWAVKDEKWGLANSHDLCSGVCEGCLYQYWGLKGMNYDTRRSLLQKSKNNRQRA